jgi:hypothetical protein
MKKEIIEGNILIKEFIGKEIRGQFGRILSVEEYAYNYKWDWLMPACYKWDSIYTIQEGSLSKRYEELCDALDKVVSCYEILPVWQQLVENIKWYNLNIK